MLEKKSLKDYKIALVYDWLTTQHGGAEQVLLALHALFPQAPLYTSIRNQEKTTWAREFTVHTSWLQKLATVIPSHRLLSPLMPLAFESLDLSSYDIVISVSSSFAKGVVTTPNQLHVSYILTPPRFIYTVDEHYLPHQAWRSWPIVTSIMALIQRYFYTWDQVASTRPDVYIPISKLVAKRVEQFYQKTCPTVVYPPYQPLPEVIDTTNFPELPHHYFLVVSRLVEYKEIEQAIRACGLLNANLLIVGTGPQQKYLQQLAHQVMSNSTATIVFLGNVKRTKLTYLYENADAVVIPGQEDFGLTGLEALSCGTPVAVNTKSGVAEVITDGVHGVHIDKPTPDSVAKALQRVQALTIKKPLLKKQVSRYNREAFGDIFINQISNLVEQKELRSATRKSERKV